MRCVLSLQTLRFRHSSARAGCSIRIQRNFGIVRDVVTARCLRRREAIPTLNSGVTLNLSFRETSMRSSFKSTLVLTTALAIALTSLDLRPAAATPEGGPAIVKQNAGASEFSAARKRRRGRGV